MSLQHFGGTTGANFGLRLFFVMVTILPPEWCLNSDRPTVSWYGRTPWKKWTWKGFSNCLSSFYLVRRIGWYIGTFWAADSVCLIRAINQQCANIVPNPKRVLCMVLNVRLSWLMAAILKPLSKIFCILSTWPFTVDSVSLTCKCSLSGLWSLAESMPTFLYQSQ